MKPIHITIALFTILISITACTHKLSTTAQPVRLDYEVKDNNGQLVLLGKGTRARMTQAPYATWFNRNYSDYKIDTATADALKPLLKGKQFLIFMGTWCGDSRREVPRMYKLLDYCGVPASHIQLVHVSNHDSAYKQSPTHEESGLNIHRVPDLLVYGIYT
jgi:hypothetical protein